MMMMMMISNEAANINARIAIVDVCFSIRANKLTNLSERSLRDADPDPVVEAAWRMEHATFGFVCAN